MRTTCLNCNDQFEGHYCNNCGQPAKTGRLTTHALWHEVEHALIHLDKGVLYTIRQLFTRPGHSIREFIEGKRARHFRPLSLVIVLTTIQALLYHYFKINFLQGAVGNTTNKTDDSFTPQMINEWMTTHVSFNMLIYLLFGSISSYLVFWKRKYNFVEHLFINSFITSQHLIVHLVLFPITYIANKQHDFIEISTAINFVNIGLSVWTFIQFFNTQSKIKIFFLSLLTHILTVAFIIVTVIIVGELLKLFLHH